MPENEPIQREKVVWYGGYPRLVQLFSTFSRQLLAEAENEETEDDLQTSKQEKTRASNRAGGHDLRAG